MKRTYNPKVRRKSNEKRTYNPGVEPAKVIKKEPEKVYKKKDKK